MLFIRVCVVSVCLYQTTLVRRHHPVDGFFRFSVWMTACAIYMLACTLRKNNTNIMYCVEAVTILLSHTKLIIDHNQFSMFVALSLSIKISVLCWGLCNIFCCTIFCITPYSIPPYCIFHAIPQHYIFHTSEIHHYYSYALLYYIYTVSIENFEG